MVDIAISKEECEKALFSMGVEKPRGVDGLTVEFFKEVIVKLAKDVDFANIRAWHTFAQSIQTIIKRFGSPRAKKD